MKINCKSKDLYSPQQDHLSRLLSNYPNHCRRSHEALHSMKDSSLLASSLNSECLLQKGKCPVRVSKIKRHVKQTENKKIPFML